MFEWQDRPEFDVPSDGRWVGVVILGELVAAVLLIVGVAPL